MFDNYVKTTKRINMGLAHLLHKSPYIFPREIRDDG